MTNELIKDRINSLQPDYRSFISSSIPTEIIRDFAEFHKFDDVKTVVLENGFALFLLFFFSDDDFTNYIISECELNRDDATTLLSGIKLSLPENILQSITETQKIVFADESSLDVDEKASGQYIPQNQENVYTSMQSAILQDQKRSPIPPPPQNS